MSSSDSDNTVSVTERLAGQGYWPAIAARHLAAGRYSSVVEVCREHSKEQPGVTSGLLIYAIALHRAGQIETALEQFYAVLARDPDNIVALKNVADIEMEQKDEPSAMAIFDKILRLDPHCRALKSDLDTGTREMTHTIKLKRGEETAPEEAVNADVDIPFCTETVGDIYLRQGYPRLAAVVFNRLSRENENPRFLEKLRQAREKIKERES